MINALSPFYSAQASGAWNGAANIQGGPSYLGRSSLDNHHRPGQRLVSMKILKPVKLTVKVNPTPGFQTITASIE